MTYDVEEDLSATLHRHAEHEVDADALLGGALARGRRRQRRRRVAMALGGAGVAGVATAALAAVPLVLGGSGNGAPVGSLETPESEGPKFVAGYTESPPARGDYAVPAVAAAKGAAGAATRPDQVGEDPTTIHFRVDSVTLPVRAASWGVQPGGVEELSMQMTGPTGGPAAVEVWLARGSVPAPEESGGPPSGEKREERPVQVGNRPGKLFEITDSGGNVTYEVRWAPVDGLEAVVRSGLSAEDTVAAAEAVKFDRAARCVTPVQSTDLPAGATVRGCYLQLAPGDVPWAPRSVVTYGDGTKKLYIETGGEPIPSASYSASPDPVGGDDAGWIDHQKALVLYDFGGFPVYVLVNEGYARVDAELVAGGLRIAPNARPERPETWSTTLTAN